MYRLASPRVKEGKSLVFMDGLQLIAVKRRIITSDGIDLAYHAPAGLSLDVHEKIQSLRDIAADGPVWKLNPGLKNTGSKSCDGLPGGVGVQRGERPGVTRIERLEQVEGLSTTHFAQKYPVRPQSQGRLQEIPHGDPRNRRFCNPPLQRPARPGVP